MYYPLLLLSASIAFAVDNDLDPEFLLKEDQEDDEGPSKQQDPVLGECLALSYPKHAHCCLEPRFPIDKHDKVIIEKCNDPKYFSVSCGIDQCIANRKGFLLPSGELNKDAIETDLKTLFRYYPLIFDRIQKACIKGDLDKYTGYRDCHIFGMKNCVMAQFLMFCTKWDPEGDCPYIGGLPEFCMDILE